MTPSTVFTTSMTNNTPQFISRSLLPFSLRRGSSQRGSDSASLPVDFEQAEAVDLSGMSFVERQEEWLRRKQNAIRAKTHEVERAVKDAATFNPNLAISQNSLRPAQVDKPIETGII